MYNLICLIKQVGVPMLMFLIEKKKSQRLQVRESILTDTFCI